MPAVPPAWTTINLSHENCIFIWHRRNYNANQDYNLSLCHISSIFVQPFLSYKYSKIQTPNLILHRFIRIERLSKKYSYRIVSFEVKQINFVLHTYLSLKQKLSSASESPEINSWLGLIQITCACCWNITNRMGLNCVTLRTKMVKDL